ncbi:MAG: GNAT family N-acetyltransferase [Caldilineaceae bacterium]|nr:GNAT family N-acetyltransferase [Caldilineaceae bacterium]HRJ44683.1 GNAT family N-acetyltransferase [Caldilineaceae bacterium]
MDTTPYGFKTLRVDPDSLDGTFTTRDGRPIRCRLIQPEDGPLLIGLFQHLSPESRRRRFNLPLEHLDPSRLVLEARHLADVDNRTVGGAVLAFAGLEESAELIAVARIGRYPANPVSPEAEAALVVRDDFQRQGIGTALMAMLALLAQRMNVETLTASIQADNEALFDLLRSLHLPLQRHTSHGETTISLQVSDLPKPQM